MGAAWWVVWGLAAGDVPADRFGYTGGHGPLDLDTRTDEPAWTRASDCAHCHRTAAEQWAESRHRVAWSNDLMQAGFVAESRAFCVHCHAPAQAQVAEVLANLATYRALSPHADPNGPAAAALRPEPKAEEGVSCVVCHLRDGEVLSARPAHPESPHPIRTDPTFGTEAACASCHDFSTPAFVDGRLVVSDEPMQATLQEWRAWRATTGRTEDCTDCHMPEGDHRMPGVHDRERVRGAIEVAVDGPPSARVLVVAAVDVGHAVPTGDLFRHVSVEVQAPGAVDWATLRVLGRRFSVDASGPVPVKQTVEDSRLQPGRPISVPLPPALSGGRFRLRMHLGGAHDEARGLVPEDVLTYVIHEGDVP